MKAAVRTKDAMKVALLATVLLALSFGMPSLGLTQFFPEDFKLSSSMQEEKNASAEEERRWIIPLSSSNTTTPECFVLSDYVSKVTRISMKEFMNHENGPGRPFLPLFQHIKTHYDKSNYLSKDKLFPSLAVEQQAFYSVRNVSGCQTHSIHNFKVGGTTIRSADIPSKKRMPYNAKMVFDSQQQQGSTNNVTRKKALDVRLVFSFVRDPVVRFVSAVRQVLSLGRCRDCSRCHEKRKEWKDSQKFISCLLDQMETNQSYLDRHLSPQAFTLYDATRGYDIHFDLMNIRELNRVLNALEIRDNRTLENSNPGVAQGYNMSSTEILSPELIRRICRMYEVDLRLVRETQLVTETMCDEFSSNETPWIPELDFSQWWGTIYSM